MTNINNILAAIVIYSLMSYILRMPDFWIGMMYALLGSQITFITPRKYKNNLLFFIPLLIASYYYPSIAIPAMIGYASTIFVELLSEKGCRLLYPISDITFVGPKNYLETGKKGDYAATTFLIVLAITAIVLSTNGASLVTNVNENPYLSTFFGNGNSQSQSGVSYANDSGGSRQYVSINPAECLNENITTTTTNNSTTTIISQYTPPVANST